MRKYFGIMFTLFFLAFATTATAASLSDTARRGNFDELKQMIPQAANVDGVWGASDRSALHWIAGDGPAELATMLIDKGANVNLTDTAKRTPLHFAAEEGNIPVMEVLLSRGANVNAKDNVGYTPLMLVAHAKKTRPEVAELLLKNGADVNAGDGTGMTMLMKVLTMPAYSSALTQHVINAKPDPNLQDGSGMTALMHCIQKKADTWQLPATVCGLPGLDINLADKNGNTALHHAALSPSEHAGSIINAFLGRGANVNARNNSGETPLFVAVHMDHSKSLATLIINGKADVNVGNADGVTVLHKAASRNNPALIQFLVDKGADITAKAKNGQTVLFAAGNNAAAKELLQKLLPAGSAAASLPTEVLVSELSSSVGDLYSGGNLYYLKVDPNKTPFTGTARQWYRNKTGERLQQEVVIKAGIPVSRIAYYDEPNSVKEAEQVIEGDYCLVKTFHRNNAALKSEESYLVDKNAGGARKSFRKSGLVKEYYENGTLSLEEEYVAGTREGLMKRYDRKTGKLIEEYTMKDSQKVGLYKEYHPNGKLMKEVPYVEGREEGVRKDYRDDGTLSQSQEFKKGRPDGARITYEKDGVTVRETKMFKEGRPVS